MKNTIFLFLLIIGTQFCFSQTEADYTSVIEKALESMKGSDAAAIHALFSDSLKGTMTLEELSKAVKSKVDSLGAPGEFEFMFDDEGFKSYLVQTESDSFTLNIGLSGDLKISYFAIE